MPSDYLLKTEPTVYSFADLQKDGVTIWDGVTNPTAVKNLREMAAWLEADYLRNRRSQERGGNGHRRFCRCLESQNSCR